MLLCRLFVRTPAKYRVFMFGSVVVVVICEFFICLRTSDSTEKRLPESEQFIVSKQNSSSSNMHRIFASTVALVLGSLISQTAAQAPIPSRPAGFVYGTGSSDAPVQLEAWVDLICPDSKAAWPTYKKVADYYGPTRVRLTALIFPLPYHRAAIHAAQGTFVADDFDSNKTLNWLNMAFESQAALYDNTIAGEPETYIIDTLSHWAADAGYNRLEFKDRLARSDPAQQLARVEFKYGCTRGVYGTPMTYVNGVVVNSSPSWTLADWKKVIDPLF